MVLAFLIESPFQGETPEKTQENIDYLYECITHCYCSGKAPVALHAVYPFLPDGKLHQDSEKVENSKYALPGREHALQCNRTVREQLRRVIFYLDKGLSNGMKRALIECSKDHFIDCRYQFIHSETKQEVLDEIQQLCRFPTKPIDESSGYFMPYVHSHVYAI
jgi:hypothetical protein